MQTMPTKDDGTDSGLEAERLHAGRDESNGWEHEPAPISVRPVTTNVVSFRMPHDEFDTLQEIAKARGQSLSGFVRDSIRARIGHLSDPDAVHGEACLGATAAMAELDAVARIDGTDVTELVRAALDSHLAARRRDPAFRMRLRREQDLLRSLAD